MYCNVVVVVVVVVVLVLGYGGGWMDWSVVEILG